MMVVAEGRGSLGCAWLGSAAGRSGNDRSGLTLAAADGYPTKHGKRAATPSARKPAASARTRHGKGQALGRAEPTGRAGGMGCGTR